jgi:hypothetical protein
MDVERTMEFILEQSARNQAMLAEMITENRERGAVIDRRLDRLERTVTRLARLGVKSRSKINGRLDDHDRWFAKHQAIHEKLDQTLAEIGDKLNALIGYVDRWPRNSPQS